MFDYTSCVPHGPECSISNSSSISEALVLVVLLLLQTEGIDFSEAHGVYSNYNGVIRPGQHGPILATIKFCLYNCPSKHAWVNQLPSTSSFSNFTAATVTFRKAWDAAEVCSGDGVLSRCLRFGRDLRVASLDVLDWDPYLLQRGLSPDVTSTIPLDLLKPAGFVFLSGI